MNRALDGEESTLVDKSRAPLSRPGDTPIEVQTVIIELRNKYPFWGAKKLLSILKREQPDAKWPSVTTVGNILKRNGYTAQRRKRSRLAETAPLQGFDGPNDTWCTDFKGWWLTKDGKACEPLTVTDGHSRFLLCCRHVQRRSFEYVWELLQEAFQEYGMPLRFRTDNGSPFATNSLGRLSRLAVRLVRLGVTPEWIRPGKPQENGRHERMHRTLKLEAATPVAGTLNDQKIALKRFQYEYNFVRPHEALGMMTPSQVYIYSPRKWTGEQNDPTYPTDYDMRRVDSSGNFYWKGGRGFTSEVLKGEVVGIRTTGKDEFEIYYGPILLGKMDLINGFTRV